MKYPIATQTQLRQAFWQGSEHLEQYVKSKRQNEYNATIRSEFVEFVDMLNRDELISNALAQRVTL